MPFLKFLLLLILFFSSRSDNYHSTIKQNNLGNKFNIQQNQLSNLNSISLDKLNTIYVSDENSNRLSKNSKFLTLIILCTFLFSIYTLNLYTKQQKHIKRLELSIQQVSFKNNQDKKQNDNKETHIEESVIYNVLIGLKDFENQLGFLDSNVTLINLSKELNTNPSYLSKIINKYKKQKFSSYLNDLRINYVLTRLKTDKKLSLYTIKAISDETGFSNSQSFTNAFYKKTGVYPSHFIKQLKTTGTINFDLT